MSDLPSPQWTRDEAVARLRECLRAQCDEEHSMCEVAARRGIFCGGFRRWHDAEFDRKWRDAIGRSTHLTRPQMEQFANLWQLVEQVRCHVPLACDAATIADAPCRGWAEFSNPTLEQYCREILGQTVVMAERRKRRRPEMIRSNQVRSPALAAQ